LLRRHYSVIRVGEMRLPFNGADRQIAAGVEYYAATGPITSFEPVDEQRHMIFPTIDLEVSPDWELNFAVGRGLTSASEHWVFKSIVGYKFKH
jgi:hypothetical protein